MKGNMDLRIQEQLQRNANTNNPVKESGEPVDAELEEIPEIQPSVSFDNTVSVQTIDSSVFVQTVLNDNRQVVNDVNVSLSPRSPRVLQKEFESRVKDDEL